MSRLETNRDGSDTEAEQGFTVLIPARLASTRLPDKPLADLGGAPMVVRVAQRARLSAARRCVVAADSIAIIEACHQHGIEAVQTRPAATVWPRPANCWAWATTPSSSTCRATNP